MLSTSCRIAFSVILWSAVFVNRHVPEGSPKLSCESVHTICKGPTISFYFPMVYCCLQLTKHNLLLQFISGFQSLNAKYLLLYKKKINRDKTLEIYISFSRVSWQEGGIHYRLKQEPSKQHKPKTGTADKITIYIPRKTRY